jgi:hypothetical protein
MMSARTRIVLCLTIVILIGIPVFFVGIRGWWLYPRFYDVKPAFPIGLAVVAVLSFALLFLCSVGRRTTIFALVFTVTWVLLLLPETQYYLDTRGATPGSIVEPFNRNYEILGYILVLFPVPFVLMGLCFRRRQTI